MSIELVTGHAGSAHVTSAQDGRLNAAAWGGGKYVLPTQAEFAVTVDSANQVTVATGDAMLEGRHVTSEAPTALTVDSGTQGMKRNDLVCVVYAKNGSGVESAALQVVKGTETSGTPTDPAIPTGSILAGDTSCAMALWRLPISGITMGTPEQLFEVADELSAGENYTYSIGYTNSTRVLKLTGDNGGASTQATLPVADGGTFGLVKTGAGITNSSGMISVQTATTSRDGLMTTTQVATLNRLNSKSSTWTGSAMGWGYMNASNTHWVYIPVHAPGRTSAQVTLTGDIEQSSNGSSATLNFLRSNPYTCQVINGGSLLQLSFTALGTSAARHVGTYWFSNITVTFS